MQFPGSNILGIALNVIAKQNFKYVKFVSRDLKENGIYVSNYAPAVMVQGSVQPADRKMYEQLGVDLNQKVITVYAPKNIFDVDRDRPGDRVIFDRETYQVISDTLWFDIDGWVRAACIGIPGDGGECC